MIRGFLYRTLMRIAHRYNWHYAPPTYPEGDMQLWCKWCGFRQTIKHNPNIYSWGKIENAPQSEPDTGEEG